MQDHISQNYAWLLTLNEGYPMADDLADEVCDAALSNYSENRIKRALTAVRKDPTVNFWSAL